MNLVGSYHARAPLTIRDRNINGRDAYLTTEITPKRHFILEKTVSEWWHPKWGRYSEEIMSIINPHERGCYLEVGVGDGRYTVPLAKCGNLVVGVDLSQEMLRKCLKNVKHHRVHNVVSFVQADAESLPFRNGTFKKVVCIATLVHVPNYEKAIDEYFRVTQAGGNVITENISLFHPSILYAWVYHKIAMSIFKKTYANLGPYYPRTPKRILSAFRKNKAEIEGTFGFFLLLPLPLVGHIDLLAFKLRESFLKFFGSGLVIRARRLQVSKTYV